MLCGWLFPDNEIKRLKKRNADRSKADRLKLKEYCGKSESFSKLKITEYHPLSEGSRNEPCLYTGISEKNISNEHGTDNYVAFGWFKEDQLIKVTVITSADFYKILSGELNVDGIKVKPSDKRYLIYIYENWQQDKWEVVQNA